MVLDLSRYFDTINHDMLLKIPRRNIKDERVVQIINNQISKDTELYKLYNTNIHEKIAEQKKRDTQSKISVD